jgi:hypothetical protein
MSLYIYIYSLRAEIMFITINGYLLDTCREWGMVLVIQEELLKQQKINRKSKQQVFMVVLVQD